MPGKTSSGHVTENTFEHCLLCNEKKLKAGKTEPKSYGGKEIPYSQVDICVLYFILYYSTRYFIFSILQKAVLKRL